VDKQFDSSSRIKEVEAAKRKELFEEEKMSTNTATPCMVV
jgi:hypothetical protein